MQTIKMPQAKPTMTKGTIVRWNKGQGDPVKKGEILALVEADEGLVELEAGVDGLLQKIVVSAGSTVEVNTVIGEIGGNTSSGQGSTTKVEPAAVAKPVAAAVPSGAVTPVVMPKAGQSMEEGTIVKWRVQPGATIKKGDVIFEIETDKATLEVEAVDEGRLARIVLPEGGTVKVLDPVAYLANNDADVDAFIASQAGAASDAAQILFSADLFVSGITVESFLTITIFIK
jgi:pyruvate dehydrogenase E2 component (dihydrolipoamide acetyltransferase)